MILVQKGLIYHPVKKSAVDKEMHTQLGLATLVYHVPEIMHSWYYYHMCDPVIGNLKFTLKRSKYVILTLFQYTKHRFEVNHGTDD